LSGFGDSSTGGNTMTIRDALQDLAGVPEKRDRPADADSEKVKEEIEKLSVRLSRCFVEVILPSVFAVENDLNQMGFWNQVNIGQSTSLSSGKPNVREATFYFFPIKDLTFRPKTQETTYRAGFRSTPDQRKIVFSRYYPKRMPPVKETAEQTYQLDKINKNLVDALLEDFIKGAVDAYGSDRILI
jgi:hypothetical protein